MELVIKGAGEVVICLVDPHGKTLIQEKIVLSGSESIESAKPLNLVARTAAGKVSMAPVLVRCSEEQRVTFDGEEPAVFVKRRCKEIGCSRNAAESAIRGKAVLLDETKFDMPRKARRL